MKFEDAEEKIVELLERRGELSDEYDKIMDSFNFRNPNVETLEKRMEEINEEMMDIDSAIYDINDTLA